MKLIFVQSSLLSLICGSPRFVMFSRKVCLYFLPTDESEVSTVNSFEKMLASLAP